MAINIPLASLYGIHKCMNGVIKVQIEEITTNMNVQLGQCINQSKLNMKGNKNAQIK